MKLKTWLAMAAGMVAFGLVAGPVQAAPAGAPLNVLIAAAAQSDSVQEVGSNGYAARHYGPRYRYLGWKHRHFRQGFRSYFAPRYQPLFRRL